MTQLVSKPTRGNSVLDLFITNINERILDVSITNPQLSDHAMVNANIVYSRFKVHNKKTVTYRQYKLLNYEELAKSVTLLDFPNNSTNINERAESFCKVLLSPFEKLIPFVSKTFTEYQSKMTISQETIKTKVLRDKLYKIKIKFPTQYNEYCFDSVNKLTKEMILSDTKSNINDEIQKVGPFKVIDNLLFKDKKNVVHLDANQLNDYFVDISTCKYDVLIIPKKPQNISVITSFNIVPLNILDLFSAWKAMKNVKSVSHDSTGLSHRMLNLSIHSPNVNCELLDILNCSIACGVFVFVFIIRTNSP